MAEFVKNGLPDVRITGAWVDIHRSFILADRLTVRAYIGEGAYGKAVETDANLGIPVLDKFKFEICVLCPLGSVLSNLKDVEMTRGDFEGQ
jgi:hypothetical protein